MTDTADTSIDRSGRGLRKFGVSLAALVAITALAAAGKLDAIAAGAIGSVLALYCHANLKAKQPGATP